MNIKDIGKLEMAKMLLDEVIEKRNHHRKKLKNRDVNCYGEDEGYYPHQQLEQLKMVRRFINEGKCEVGGKCY